MTHPEPTFFEVLFTCFGMPLMAIIIIVGGFCGIIAVLETLIGVTPGSYDSLLYPFFQEGAVFGKSVIDITAGEEKLEIKPEVKIDSKNSSLEIEILSNNSHKKLLLRYPRLTEVLSSRYLTIGIRVIASVALMVAMYTGSLSLIAIFGFIFFLSLMVKVNVKSIE